MRLWSLVFAAPSAAFVHLHPSHAADARARHRLRQPIAVTLPPLDSFGESRQPATQDYRLSESPLASPLVEPTHETSLAEWQTIALAKVRLLSACEAAAMGRDVSRRASVLEIVEALEALNPTPRPLDAPHLLSGTWRLVFTTSDLILGLNRARPFRPDAGRLLQSIDATTLLGMNEEWVLNGWLKNSARSPAISVRR